MFTDIFSGRGILIVEDDFSSRLYLNKILEKTGARLCNATDGKQAYEMTLADTGIEVVLMDIQLPVIDGYTCARMLRESGRKVTIIAQTAFGMSGDKENMIASGFDDYLIKPISQNALIEKISVFLK